MALRLGLASRFQPEGIRNAGEIREARVCDEIRATDITLHESKTEHYDTLNIEQWEQRLIQEALRRTKANIPEAADLLGISRATMYRKLESYGINKDEFL